VLVDAPCSGLGTIRRRPEIKWRLSADQLSAFAVRQGEILAGAAGAVRPGGRLVFAVCTIEPEEGPAVAAGFLRAQPHFEPVPIAGWPPGAGGAQPPAAIAGSPGTAFLWPRRHGTDGFFVAAFRRRM
jgi:16S rRNA (cytosine967-C5)-methyltransferase